MKKYIQIHIYNIDAAEQEKLIALLDDNGAIGFEQNETDMIAYFDETNFAKSEIKTMLGSYEVTLNDMLEQNWNEVWESNFQPVTVDDFCSIRASFHKPIKDITHEIIITPKMSFGTGHHATTYMMIQQMKDLDFQNRTVFDFGTGTGILAILAEKLGATSVTAIDVDEWSIENARENINTNGCSKVHLYNSSVVPHQQFDIILANINRNVIIQHFDEIADAAKPASAVLISGLLITDQVDIVKEAQLRNMELIKQISKNNWVCLLFVKGTLSAY